MILSWCSLTIIMLFLQPSSMFATAEPKGWSDALHDQHRWHKLNERSSDGEVKQVTTEAEIENKIKWANGRAFNGATSVAFTKVKCIFPSTLRAIFFYRVNSTKTVSKSKVSQTITLTICVLKKWRNERRHSDVYILTFSDCVTLTLSL